MSRGRPKQRSKAKAVRRPAKTAKPKEPPVKLAQAKVRYSDGQETLFVSRDGGQTFYENAFPDPKAATSPMKFSRGWLKAAAQSECIKSIEFMEV
jgi:hypothetical protein